MGDRAVVRPLLPPLVLPLLLPLLLTTLLAPADAAGTLLHLPGLECFERVAIGRRLNNTDVSRTLTTRTVNQCEQECERDQCNAYSFGIGARGNGTCEISLGKPENEPVEDTDFDFFLMSGRCQNKTGNNQPHNGGGFLHPFQFIP